MADNSAALALYARDRHEAATTCAIEVLRRLEADGGAITYATVAAATQVSRAWPYTQPALRAAIDDLRARNRVTTDHVPVRQQASDASLLRRLTQAHDRNRELDDQVRLLRQQLAAAHGELRAAQRTGPASGL